MTIPAKQHGLIPMTKDLRSNANTHAIPQQRCSYPMSDVMHSQICSEQFKKKPRTSCQQFSQSTEVFGIQQLSYLSCN
jgi:hypothetical protein